MFQALILYNSVYARTNGNETFQEKAFNLQTEYWAENSNLSLTEQQKITHNLLGELETIRVSYREEFKSIDQFVKHFENDHVQPGVRQEFYELMKSISLSCSQFMGEFAGSIIRESVELLNIRPPCEFDAVAIGSIARGEATPYSDLEYLFLVEKKTPETIRYFEMLALTSYFLIGNLSETKLSYMAIEELKGWFHDTSKNGFKIDGLSEGAGNIPNGNGSEVKENHFIVTPQELADRYQGILHNPDPTESLRGDLTAMLSNTTTLYSHADDGVSGKLLLEFREKQATIKPNQAREDANMKMLTTDAEKFNFVPDEKLSAKGYSADVKKEIYRFPSILLLDVCIVGGSIEGSSWESLELLERQIRLSQDVSERLKLLLASASYIRLASYLFHNSQDDRMSLAQHQRSILKGNQKAVGNQGDKKWFLSIGMFASMCMAMTPLKLRLASKHFQVQQLQTMTLDINTLWSKVSVMFYTLRRPQAMSLLQQQYHGIYDNPVQSALEITESFGSGEAKTLYLIAEGLFWSGQYRAALQVYNYLTYEGISDRTRRIADCYMRLGDYQTAVDILNTIQDKSSSDYKSLGETQMRLTRNEDAERNLMLALQMEVNRQISVTATDYYDQPLGQQKSESVVNQINLTRMSPEERLHIIQNLTPKIINRLSLLGQIYCQTKKHTQATAYLKKSLQCISEVYGEGAVAKIAAQTLDSLALNYRESGQYAAAEECYNKALSIFRQLPETIDQAKTLYGLGILYESYAINWEMAKACYIEALELCNRLQSDHPIVASIHSRLSRMRANDKTHPQSELSNQNQNLHQRQQLYQGSPHLSRRFLNQPSLKVRQHHQPLLHPTSHHHHS